MSDATAAALAELNKTLKALTVELKRLNDRQRRQVLNRFRAGSSAEDTAQDSVPGSLPGTR